MDPERQGPVCHRGVVICGDHDDRDRGLFEQDLLGKRHRRLPGGVDVADRQLEAPGYELLARFVDAGGELALVEAPQGGLDREEHLWPVVRDQDSGATAAVVFVRGGSGQLGFSDLKPCAHPPLVEA